jgi:hypothetical protein
LAIEILGSALNLPRDLLRLGLGFSEDPREALSLAAVFRQFGYPIFDHNSSPEYIRATRNSAIRFTESG